MKLYVNGEQQGDSWSTTQNFSNSTLSVFDVEQGLSCSNAERFDGKISELAKGRFGFGYDPIFIPLKKRKTFGEMKPSQKYKIDHRYQAFKKIKKFL